MKIPPMEQRISESVSVHKTDIDVVYGNVVNEETASFGSAAVIHGSTDHSTCGNVYQNTLITPGDA